MFKTIRGAALAAVIVCVSAFAQKPSDAPAAPQNPKGSSATRSTASGRQSVEVTIYNSDLGLIKERRKVKIPAGVGELQFAGVAAAINPVTVHVRPLANASDFSILEQNYEYDLISHAKLMDKYVGKKIKIVDWNEYQDRKTTVEAELISNNAGEVYKIGNEIYLGHPGTKVLPELPGNLISRPTLSWVYSNKTEREYQLEVSYMTNGMSWNADYILAVAAPGKPAGLSGWVTVNNMSGAAYENAKLNLVAGNVNRVRQEFGGARMARAMAAAPAMMADQAAGFGQSEVFEYHIYDLQRQTTIKENQTKQISLLEAHGVTVTREYVTSPSNFEAQQMGGGAGLPVKQPVNAFFTFKNTKENKLGSPLPAGTVRIYTDDAKGSRQFIGEDRIAHTPKDEEVRLKAGEAFDIVAERTQTGFKQISAKMQESEFKISLRNRKNEDITVRVLEPARGNWNVAESSHKHTKADANTLRFDVPVEKGKEVIVKYKIRVGI